MNKLTRVSLQDYLFVIGTAFFFFGCIASMHRSGKTLDPGQASFSASYVRAEDLDNSNAEPVQLVAVDSRFGIANGMDIGLAHTWDVSKGNNNTYATFWGDVKFQLTNKDNQIGKPIFSSGLMKGYIYDKNAKLHVTTIPVILSLPVSDRMTPFIIYRYELIRNDFIPGDLKNPRHTFAVGIEMSLSEPTIGKPTSKIGFSIGTFNSLTGGKGDNGLTLNLGLIFDTPRKK
jgi:hypothetical protein